MLSVGTVLGISDVERRRSIRYFLRVPVIFVSQGAYAGGFTRDISGGSVYVLCGTAECPVSGSDIRLELMLPPLAGGRGLKLKGAGRALRREITSAESGFAAEIEFESETDSE